MRCEDNLRLAVERRVKFALIVSILALVINSGSCLYSAATLSLTCAALAYYVGYPVRLVYER